MDLKNFISERRVQEVLDKAKQALNETKKEEPVKTRASVNDNKKITNVASEEDIAKVRKLKPTQYVRMKRAEDLKKAEEMAKIKSDKKFKKEEAKKLELEAEAKAQKAREEAEAKAAAQAKRDEEYDKFKNRARNVGLGLGTLSLGRMILDDDED